jgi:hypothetical protein
MNLRDYLAATKTNFKGMNVDRNIVVIESDDWGAIRTHSKEALKAFKNKGYNIADSIYKIDALASQDDLELLFEVLQKHKGADGKPAKLTANAIMANPDFEKIKESRYTNYYYEDFTETFKRYPNHSKNLEIWKKAKEEGVFRPQFHGREHLNYKRWLKVLKHENEAALFCFAWNTTYSGSGDYSFMEAYDWDTKEDLVTQKKVIQEGLKIFERTFGESSKSFIPPCYTLDPELETTLVSNKLEWLQGIKVQKVPTGKFGEYHYQKRKFGEVSQAGLRFNIRNCFFEPSMDLNKDVVNDCLLRISSAFLWNKPAVISSHRINFVGYIDEKNRDRGLRLLDELLREILKKWPDVQFISTDELDEYLVNK